MTETTKSSETEVTTGLDIGDRKSTLCTLDSEGAAIERGEVATNKQAMTHRFSIPGAVVALETDTYSAWITELLQTLGHDVIVANPRKVRSITDNDSKNGRFDAEQLARLARADRRLLSPITHRGPKTRADLALRPNGKTVEQLTRNDDAFVQVTMVRETATKKLLKETFEKAQKLVEERKKPPEKPAPAAPAGEAKAGEAKPGDAKTQPPKGNEPPKPEPPKPEAARRSHRRPRTTRCAGNRSRSPTCRMSPRWCASSRSAAPVCRC